MPRACRCPGGCAPHQPVAQRRGVGAHPHQPHRLTAEGHPERRPRRRLVDLGRERSRQQHRTAVVPDLTGRRGHSRVLVQLDVPVVPGALALPGGRPAAANVAATNPPYIVSLSSSAGTGDSRASSRSATVDLPAPGGPATTHTVARSPTARHYEPRVPILRAPGEGTSRGPQRVRHRPGAGDRQVGGHPRPHGDAVAPSRAPRVLPPADRLGGRARRRPGAHARPLPAAPGVRPLLRAHPRRPARRHRPHRVHPAARAGADRLPHARRRRRPARVPR